MGLLSTLQQTERLYDKMIGVVAQVDASVAKLAALDAAAAASAADVRASGAALARAYDERRASIERQTAWLNAQGWGFSAAVILLSLVGGIGGAALVLYLFR